MDTEHGESAPAEVVTSPEITPEVTPAVEPVPESVEAPAPEPTLADVMGVLNSQQTLLADVQNEARAASGRATKAMEAAEQAAQGTPKYMEALAGILDDPAPAAEEYASTPETPPAGRGERFRQALQETQQQDQVAAQTTQDAANRATEFVGTAVGFALGLDEATLNAMRVTDQASGNTELIARGENLVAQIADMRDRVVPLYKSRLAQNSNAKTPGTNGTGAATPPPVAAVSGFGSFDALSSSYDAGDISDQKFAELAPHFPEGERFMQAFQRRYRQG